MILDEHHASAFRDFAKPLQRLEKKIKKIGIQVLFHAFVGPREIKMVRILRQYKRDNELVCIEWASPAQAVKIVAEAAGL